MAHEHAESGAWGVDGAHADGTHTDGAATQADAEQRRLRLLHDLASRAGEGEDDGETCRLAAEILGRHRDDLPFALLYLVDRLRPDRARLAASTGVERGSRLAPTEVVLAQEGDDSWHLGEALRTASPFDVEEHGARVVPLTIAKERAPEAVLIAGRSRSSRPDDDERAFVDVVGALIAAALARARLYEEQQRAHSVRRRSEATERGKDEFLAMLAHELRNPLTPILMAAQTLKRRFTGLPEMKQLDILERQARNLVRLVDDILDVTRIARGKLELRREPIDLTTVVARALETTRAVVEGRQHELEVALPNVPVVVDVDPIRVEQIAVNLVTNAAKYTEPGGHIRVEVARDGDLGVLRVVDDGLGIPPDLRVRIFDLFEQAGRDGTRATGGLGLGLTIVRRLAELHGGSVDLVSEGARKGSTFVVRLPLARAER